MTLLLTLALTDEQSAVVEDPASNRTIVLAGPGTGKTHTLVARAQALVDQGLSPGQGVLALSFSRAAVTEVRQRARSSATDARFVRVQTIDSFASVLLADYNSEDEWISGTFDERIVLATELLKAGNASERLSHIEHVLIDEIQDLVGVRCEFILELLKTLDCGFTLFGDPAQAIYGFQVAINNGRSPADSSTFVEQVKTLFPDARKVSIHTNHRSVSAEASSALWAGDELNSVAPNFNAIGRRLRDTSLSLPSFSCLADAAPMLCSGDAKTAILCRNNAQALLVSQELSKHCLPHSLRRSSTDRAIAGWVALAALGSQHTILTQEEMFEKLSVHLDPVKFDYERAWNTLTAIAGSRATSIEFSALRRGLTRGFVPDEIVAENDSRVVVSTIHRAKGLEFERVILIGPQMRLHSSRDLAEEARLLYVAMTRASREMFTSPFIETHEFKKYGPRWFQYGPERWRINSIEACSGDLERSTPFMSSGATRDAMRTQHYIAAHVKPNDPVTLNRLLKTDEVRYLIEHNGVEVGVTSESFKESLLQILKIGSRWTVNWPASISGFRVDFLETVAGSPASTEKRMAGRSGFWLQPRLFGLGALKFPLLHRGSDHE